MMLTKRVRITFACLLLALLTIQRPASAATSPVFLYDADQSTTTGSTPSVLDAGVADVIITDASSAGNNGKVGSGTPFTQFNGSVETVEDDPFDAVGQLSFSFDGVGRINTDAIDLLTDTLIASNGGYTFDVWMKVPENPAGLDVPISFAGTEQLNLTAGGQLQNVNRRGGDLRAVGPAEIATDNQWHHVILRFDTSKDSDGSTGSDDLANGNLMGNISAVIDGVHYDVGTGGTGTFGDNLDRSMAVGGHPEGFSGFNGLLYNPSASLGVDEAFGGIRLYVNRNTGEGHLVHFGDPVELDAYTVESAGATDVGAENSLDPVGWNSLQDQGFDGDSLLGDFNGDSVVDGADFLAWQRGEVSDPPETSDLTDWENGYGDAGGGAAPWSESGTPSDALLAETRLSGSSTISDDQSLSLPGDTVSLANSVSLGNLFVVGEDEDLSFSYHVAGETNDRVGLITYFTPAPVEGEINVVPEPTSVLILLLGVTVTGLTRFCRDTSV